MQKDLLIAFIPKPIGYSEIKVGDYIKPHDVMGKVKNIFTTHINGYESLAFETYAGNKYVSAQVHCIYSPTLCSKIVNEGDKFYSTSDYKEHVCRNIFPDISASIEDENGLSHYPNSCLKIISKLTTENIEKGDNVVVEFNDGVKPTGQYLVGILTRKWDEYPFCEIDGEEVDLASEAHSSKVYKII